MLRILICTMLSSIVFFTTVSESNADFFVTGVAGQSTFHFSSNEMQVTADEFFTWSSDDVLFAPPGIVDAPRISSYNNVGDFVSGDLGGGPNGVFGLLETPFEISSAAGTSTVIGIVFDGDDFDDDFHVFACAKCPDTGPRLYDP